MSSVGGPGARERKKRETRTALHRAALELLRDGGPACVTTEAVAARAGVSARTFFNYYATKEAALAGVDPELPARLAAQVRARAPEESPTAAVRAVMTERIHDLARERDLWRLRREVTARFPTLAAAMLGANALAERAIAAAVCERVGVSVTEAVGPAVQAYAALGAVRAALWQHAEAGFEGDLDERIEAAFAALARHTGPA